jgi:hypothetical protein
MLASLWSHIDDFPIDQFKTRLGMKHARGDHALVFFSGPTVALNDCARHDSARYWVCDDVSNDSKIAAIPPGAIAAVEK